ncbi:DUF7263 family protein [Haloplanus aerogenes]|uniref:Uncharacterized protein n=1 Tax=Haloplanus aerogenes TaxID=660522 RepID=A0A3M0DVH0_9EURY|nr:hypothetical protein [Haloplanus aerogenes]AZH24529.1 hypothetical protein DU502_03640 [Haloplanus aerogenes]RMB23819.1 hypothetical protein ATH50_1049 [Haloplanus aerogenes]
MRAQTNLVALVLALVLLTGATVIGVTFADAALADADREPLDRHAATAVADRLVAADAPTTVRANALNASVVDDLNASRIEALAPPAEGAALRITLDGETVVDRGAPSGGATIRRSVVVVSRSEPIQRAVNVTRGSALRVPRGVGRATVAVDPGPNTTLRTVRANGRVVLYDGSGLDTNTTVRLSRYEPTTIRVAPGANATGRVAVTYRQPRTEPRTLTVTVDV